MKIYLKIIATFTLAVILAHTNFSQSENQPKEPTVRALTEDEKKVDAENLISNQPDFLATESYFSARAISGFSSERKVARKGNRYRMDTGVAIAITELNSPVISINNDKTFETSVGVHRPFVSATVPLNPVDLLGFEDISFLSLGTIEIGGSRLLKIQAKSKEFEQDVFLYADLGRKNLITIIQIQSPQRSSIQRLQNISFEVPSELFDLKGYREQPKFKWEKVSGAKVLKNGTSVNEAMVFRHQDYLYIHFGEFNHILVDLKKGIADTVVYRGLLLAKNGAYVWRTTDNEAISIGDIGRHIAANCDSCVKIQYRNNTVTIPNREKKSEVIELSW